MPAHVAVRLEIGAGSALRHYARCMNWMLLISAFGALATILTFVIGALSYHRQFPKRSMEFDVVISPLAKLDSDHLSFSYRNKRLAEPYIATVRLSARSRADISSSSFDAGRPIAVKFDRPIIGMSTAKGSLVAHAVGEELQLPPQLVHRRDKFQVSLVFDHEPSQPELINPLVDIELLAREESDKHRRRLERVQGVGALLLVLTFLSLVFVLGAASRAGYFPDENARENPTAGTKGSNVYSSPSYTSDLVATIDAGVALELICSAFGDPSDGSLGRTWLWYLTDIGWVADTEVDSGTIAPVRRGCTEFELHRAGDS